MRRSTFTVDAKSVQGNESATVTFRTITVGAYHRYRNDPDISDRDLVRDHVVKWDGIVDDDDRPLPNPADEPEVLDALYLHEQGALAILLVQGPDGENASKN